MSVGSIAGGYLGARFTMHQQAKFWVFRILVTVLVLEIAHLGIQYGANFKFPVRSINALLTGFAKRQIDALPAQ